MSVALATAEKFATSPLAVSRQDHRVRQWLVFFTIVAFTLVIRWPELGNPAPDFDEQLYFLAGDRMWSGAIPFVDIWDRKPVGLFLIYAAIRALGGDGIIQYQLVAAGFAAATAWLVYRITTRFADWKGALTAALIYVLYLRALNSRAGQTETFLMLFCVATMLLAAKSLETNNDRTIQRYALAAMLVMGAALQVKYTVLPQCIFFGLFFLWRIGSRSGFNLALLRLAAVFVGLGLMPTALVAAWYYFAGYFEPFVYANFTSIFERGKLTGDVLEYCVTYSAVMLFPLVILAVSGWLDRDRTAPSATAFAIIGLWGVSCAVGVFMTGSIYIHYCVPIAPALAIMVGAFVTRSPIRYAGPLALLAYVLLFSGYVWDFAKNRQDIVAMDRMTAAIKPHVGRGCLYVYDGPSALYTTTGSCLPTTRPYPDHLNNMQEKDAMGLKQASEVARILSNRPVAIVTAYPKVVPELSPEPNALVRAAIARDYRFVTRQTYDRRSISVYLRNDLRAPQLASRTR